MYFVQKFEMLFAEGSKENLLQNAFDIKMNYSFQNELQRNLSGEGIVMSPEKFSFKLNGRGSVIRSISESKIFYFISSELQNLKKHGVFSFFEKDDNCSEIFNKIDENLKDNNFTFPIYLNAKDVPNQETRSFLSCFKCHVQFFKAGYDVWELGLEEI